MKKKYIIALAVLLVCSGSSVAQIVWSGPNMTFTKANGASPTLPANQDNITALVTLTRGGSSGVYNIVSEASNPNACVGNSPAGTEWALGTTANYATLTYQPLPGLFGCNMTSVVNQPMVLHLITENIYIDITFTQWSSGSGGGFSYIRSTCLAVPGSLVPDLPVLSDLMDPCIVTPAIPTATGSCGTIMGNPSVPLPITTQGTTVVTWTYADGTNTITQTQNVILNDVTTPIPDVASLPDSTYWCSANILALPTATDNCDGVINGTTTTALPLSSGLTVVTWTYTDGNGNSVSQNQNITLELIDNGISQLNNTTLTADLAGASYVWIDCDNGNAIVPGANAQTFSPPVITGNYAVVVFLNGCSDTSSCLSIIPVGINESESINNVSVYPNPTDGIFTISLAELNQSSNVIVYDILGNAVLSKNLTLSKTTIDLTENGKGIYFVNVHTSEGLIVKKVILQ